jgi:Tfp pilus assembly protein PilP
MTMVARSGFVLLAAMLAVVPARAQGQAAIDAARGARTDVERASQGTPTPAAQPPAQAPAPATGQPTAQPSPAPPATAGQAATPPAPPAAAGQAPTAPAAATTPGETPIEPPGFTYDPDGRRDPFVSLVRRGSTTTRGTGSGAARPAGLAGLETAEVTLRGTVRSREGFVGILQGADQKTYIVRAGDKLFDGTVRTISQNDMVILQQVNDPLSLEKQREVRKVLRQAEAN